MVLLIGRECRVRMTRSIDRLMRSKEEMDG